MARFAIPNWLTPSRYLLTPSLAREGTGESALALVEDMASIVVHGDNQRRDPRAADRREAGAAMSATPEIGLPAPPGARRRATASTAPRRWAAACTASGR